MDRLLTISIIQTGPMTQISAADWLQGGIPAWGPWPWPQVSGRLWGLIVECGLAFVSLNGGVMRHTKLPSSPPAGKLLACTKRKPSPNMAAFQSLLSIFISTSAFMSWSPVRHVALCACSFLPWGSSDSFLLYLHVPAGEAFDLVGQVDASSWSQQ